MVHYAGVKPEWQYDSFSSVFWLVLLVTCCPRYPESAIVFIMPWQVSAPAKPRGGIRKQRALTPTCLRLKISIGRRSYQQLSSESSYFSERTTRGGRRYKFEFDGSLRIRRGVLHLPRRKHLDVGARGLGIAHGGGVKSGGTVRRGKTMMRKRSHGTGIFRAGTGISGNLYWIAWPS